LTTGSQILILGALKRLLRQINRKGFKKMSDFKIKDMVLIAVMTAVICVLGPLSLPIGPVPISLTNFAVLLTIYVLGMKRGTISLLLYILLGLVGLPVFSGFTGGPAKLFGPTGGYIIGFIPMALIAGAVIERNRKSYVRNVIAMVLATLVLYALGTAYLAYSAHMTFGAALAAGVIPFALLDFVKIVICVLVGPILFGALQRAGLVGRARA
jgi:biotin transport system substrate-specific component